MLAALDLANCSLKSFRNYLYTMAPILLYHRISNTSPKNDPMKLSVPTGNFRKQMSYLHNKNYRCISLEEYYNFFKIGQPPPRKSFVITFDDGYDDLYTEVWPILEEFGFSATIFFVASLAGKNSNWEGQNAHLSSSILTWEQLRELSESRFIIGSHSLTHPRLRILSNSQVEKEVHDSKRLIEDRIGKIVNFFSYPYSDFDEKTQKIVSQSGYKAACGGDRGTISTYNLIRSQCVSKDKFFTFKFKVSGYHYKILKLKENYFIRHLLNFIKYRL